MNHASLARFALLSLTACAFTLEPGCKEKTKHHHHAATTQSTTAPTTGPTTRRGGRHRDDHNQSDDVAVDGTGAGEHAAHRLVSCGVLRTAFKS